MNKNMQIAVVVGAVIVAASVWYALGYKKPVNNTYKTNTTNTKTDSTTTACQAKDLTIALANGGGAAGSYYYNIVLTNAGKEPCTVSGSPKVVALDSKGAFVGQTALPPHASVTLTIGEGEKVYANIGFPNTKNFDAGVCKPVDHLVVYLADQTDGLTIKNIASYQSDYTSGFCQAFNLSDFSATAS